jgi:hypothetical protein
MPRGQKAKVISKVEVENKSMTSRMTEENFDKLMLRNMVTEIRNGKKVLLKCDFYVTHFYIQGKKGTINIWKRGDTDTFGFSWVASNVQPYIDKCCQTNESNCFDFKSFGEFDEKLKQQFICKYHVSCRDIRDTRNEKNCSADYLISPEEQCAICLNDIQIHLLEETACGHKFCLSCLNTYVESKVGQRKIPCPTCRRNIRFCVHCENAKYVCDGVDGCLDEDDNDDE